ncbi:MAG: FAD-dependent oxidoreductase [Hyphomicrobiales bacterium]|nr:FAD-dependent oxidoreductase [Hyphomicrobiales bacterium]
MRNRFVQGPMCAMYAAPDGSATRQTVEYYRTRAAGGAALIIVEITFTDDGGSRAFHAQLGAHSDTMIPGLSDVAEAIAAQGALPGLQLGHCGPQRVISEGPLVAPSAIPWAPGKRVPAALTTAEIEQIVQDHAAATRRAVQAGFQLLEVHAAHGYLANAFLTPASNTRTDGYGGSFENRLRFLLDVVAVMRAQLGRRRLLSIRLNGDDLLPGGLGLDDYCRVARALADHGVDILHVSAGTYRVMERRIPPMYLENESFAKYAGILRKACGLPVIASGTIHNMHDAARLVACGEADLVALARPLFADPDLPSKVLDGRPDEVLPCIRCNTCLGREQGGRRGFCAVNPQTGREHETDAPSRLSRRIGIVGAGPSGIQMALSAAARGHRVTLWEKHDRIGGLLRAAAMLPFKSTLPRLLRYYETALAKAEIDVRLGREVDPAALGDDIVVLATGIRWRIPEMIQEHATIPICTPEQVTVDKDRLGSRVLVVGAGLIGAETAWALALTGRSITIVERDEDLDEDINLTARTVIELELARCGVQIRLNTEVEDVIGGTAWMSENGIRRGQPCDAVVWTARPRDPIRDAMGKAKRQHVLAIGECDGARGLYEATSSAHRAACRL